MIKAKILRIASIILTLVITMSTMVSEAEKFHPNADLNIGEGKNVTAIASSQVYNILYTVKTNIGSIRDLDLMTFYNSSRVEILTCSPGLDVIPSDVEISGGVNISYYCSGNLDLGSGKYIYEGRYNAPSTISVADAKAAFSNAVVSAHNTSGTALSDTCVTFAATLMGDINGDNQISASDALMALQASTQSITLTPAQSLAGDVTRNGSNDATDAMLILQYSTAKIASFWGVNSVVSIPTTENTNIVDGRIYRIENIYSGKYMKATSTITNSAVKQYTYVKTDTAFKFKFQYIGSGEYKIIPQNSTGRVLSINSSGNFVLDTDTTVANKRWYIASYGSGYCIINKSSTSEFLSVEGATGTNTAIVNSINVSGSIWRLNNASITINNYYDYGYNVRYSTFPSTFIRERQVIINDAINQLFGASVTMNNPVLISSYGDKCHTDYGQQITVSNIDNPCTHADNSSCTNEAFPNHHKGLYAINGQFLSWCETNSITADICVLTTGYKTCNINTTTMVHHYDNPGVHYMKKCTVSIDEPESGDNWRLINSLNIMLHEESHALGAGGNADTQHGQCEMSYNVDGKRIYEDIRDGEYNAIYCDACKNAIINGLKYF